jgi:hypothetical protein
MNENGEIRTPAESAADLEMLDPKVREALSNFKASVHAWSEAMSSRPRTIHESVARWNWRLATAWALGCVLVFGSISGGVYDHHRRQELARIAAAKEAEQQRQLAAERTREEEDLMAKIDSDVSREVPSAMEPLASLMNEDEEAQTR